MLSLRDCLFLSSETEVVVSRPFTYRFTSNILSTVTWCLLLMFRAMWSFWSSRIPIGTSLSQWCFGVYRLISPTQDDICKSSDSHRVRWSLFHILIRDEHDQFSFHCSRWCPARCICSPFFSSLSSLSLRVLSSWNTDKWWKPEVTLWLQIWLILWFIFRCL